MYPLWEPTIPFPARDGLSYPEGAVDVVVHRAGEDQYNFLHDAAVVAHDGALFAAWYNCPEGEMTGESCIRCRRSTDAGATWSAPEVITSDAANAGILYVPVAFLSHAGTLYAFVSNMIGPDLVTACEIFVLEPDSAVGAWRSAGFIAEGFLPNCAPVLMDDGHFIMAGRVAPSPGEKALIPAVAIGRAADPARPWEVLHLLPDGRAPGGAQLPYPETSVIVEGGEVTALVRNDHGNALLLLSTDYGRSSSPPQEHNFPIGAAKAYAGVLSTGQRYLLSNTPASGYRELLTLAVSRPGDTSFRAMWKIRDGYAGRLAAGPEWSYPCAVEHQGRLFIVYTSAKKHCVMTSAPISSLAAD